MVDFTFLIERLGDGGTAALLGFLLGMTFGFFAQRSKFCLRAAAIEFVRGTFGARLAVWLFVFAGAVVGTQLLISFGLLKVGGIRMLNLRGSLSGAMIGGALFGVGMVLSRGCAGRLLVLAGQGNLRSLLSGLVFAVTAQAALVGLLSPLRNYLANLWTIEGTTLDALATFGLGPIGGFVIALIWLGAAIYFGVLARISFWGWMGGLMIGLTIMGGWLLTYWLSMQAFEPQAIKSLTFTGPSAHALMLVLSPPGSILDFDVGLVPGVVVGSFLSACGCRELKLEGFQGGESMRRYLFGALLMGFGGMLAGGCTIGSVSGASVFATTAWTTLLFIWIGGAVTDALLDRPNEPALPPGIVVPSLSRAPSRC